MSLSNNNLLDRLSHITPSYILQIKGDVSNV